MMTTLRTPAHRTLFATSLVLALPLAIGACGGKDTKGYDFAFVPGKTSLSIQRSPAGESSPMSTDRSIDLAPGAKVALAPSSLSTPPAP